MLDWAVYLAFAGAILLIVLAIYNIICFVNILRFDKKIKENPTQELEKSSKFNLWLLIIKKSKKLKHQSKQNIPNSAKKVSRVVKIINITLTGTIIQVAAYLIIVATIAYQLSTAFTTASTVLTAIFGKKDCICYAKCTGDPEDDTKTAYELLFGPDEYEKLCVALSLSPQDKENLQAMHNNNPSGKTEGEFIIAHLTDEAVQCYKSIVANNNKFRHGDHKDRTQMTNDELKEDLKSLLSDYKVEGRNPNCKSCTNKTDIALSNACIGEKHYVEGWTWEEIWDSDDTIGDGSGSDDEDTGTPGNVHSTSIYDVELDDGTYYWYHQDGGNGCGCIHCGIWSPAYWGNGSSEKKLFGKNGCAIYSLAIGISNLVDKAVTPAVVLENLGSPIKGNDSYTNPTYFIDRDIKREPVANKLASIYGLEVTHVSKTIESIDAILDKGGYVWGSWNDSQSPWCGNGSTHFMMIRKKSGNNYYCFTSCRGKCTAKANKPGAIETMNYPVSKTEVISAMTDGQLYGFVNPNKGLSGDISTDLKQDAMSFFDKENTSKGNPVIELTSGVYLYDGLPWDGSNAYRLNTSKVKTYISNNLGVNVTSSFATDKNCYAWPTIDGVKCVSAAGYPIMSFLNIDEAGCPVGWAGSTRPNKFCAILKDKSGNIYYLPCSSQEGDGFDAKGHTWPGGLVQTFLSSQGHTVGNWKFNTDNGHITGDIINVKVTSVNDIKAGYGTVKYDGGKATAQLNLEINSTVHGALSKKYSLVGFISWK